MAIAGLAFTFDRPFYFAALRFLIIVPQNLPFLDARQVPAVIDCWQRGFNVYKAFPCDPMHRVWAYSPVWLWAGFIPPWRNWMGLALDGTFLLSIALLPPPRRSFGAIVLVAAMLSSMSVYALERGNMDLVMFMLIVIGGRLWLCSFAFRLAGYLLFASAGLLKFYPFVLFSLFMRERTGIFIALCLAALALLAAFIAAYHDILREAAANLPRYPYFTDPFGATQLPGGLLSVLDHLLRRSGLRYGVLLAPAAQAGLFMAGWAILTMVSIGAALILAACRDFVQALGGLAHDERGFLIIGAAVICGCFFAGTNDSYRGIYFLFVIPGIAPLPGAGSIRVFRITLAFILFVMLGLAIEVLIAIASGCGLYPMSGSLAIDAYWIVHQLAWWWIISVLLAVLFCFIAQSPVWQALRGLARRAMPAEKQA